ncbi:MAG: MBL fold metallo-hydrolase [Acidimicrobiales bacterium]
MLQVADQWFERERIDDAITLLTEPAVHPLLRCNIWHVKGRKRDLVIDTGLGVASLTTAAADLFGAEVLAVATHSDMDHLGSFHEFENRAIHEIESTSAETAAEGLTLDVDGYDKDTLAWFTKIGYDVSGGLLAAIPHDGFDIATHELVGSAPTVVLTEGDVVDLGDRAFEVLHLPGHSPGSIGLWEEKTGVLFSGDAVYDGPLLDQIPGSDIADYLETMERLARLPVTVVHAGHDPSMSPETYRSVIRAYVESRNASQD